MRLLQIFLKVVFSKCWKAEREAACGRLICRRFHAASRCVAFPLLRLLQAFNDQYFVINTRGMCYQKDHSSQKCVIKTRLTFSSHKRRAMTKDQSWENSRALLPSLKVRAAVETSGLLLLGLTASLIKDTAWTLLLE